MFLRVEENPNCEALEGRVFQERAAPRPIRQVRRQVNGKDAWWDVTGVGENFTWQPALARKVDDSGDGTCYLVTGGEWGLRYKKPDDPSWNAATPAQSGEAFLLVPSSGEDLQFLDPSHG